MLAEGLRSMARQLVAAAGFPRLLVGSYNNRDQQGREKGGDEKEDKISGRPFDEVGIIGAPSPDAVHGLQLIDLMIPPALMLSIEDWLTTCSFISLPWSDGPRFDSSGR